MDEIKPFMEALLGLKALWTLTHIEADLEAGRVDLYVDFLPGSRWPCPECGKGNCPRTPAQFEKAYYRHAA